jgi:prevent-host-death family protein
MTTQINIHDAKTHFSRWVDRAHAGEEIVVAKNGVPYARLAPLRDAKPAPRKPGLLKGLQFSESFFDPLPDEMLDAFSGGGA